jgi:Lrp/AsnC family transcriptional regulator, leucine-responsive regulatory protein
MAVAMANRRSCLSVAYEPNLLGDINRRLLNELQRDGRVAFAELGRRVGLSAPAVAERVGRLEREGVITGYRAEVDPKAIGYALAAVVRVQPFARQIHKIPEIAAQTPEIIECERITGEDCFLLRLHVRAMDELEPVLDRFTPFGQTTTSIVHSAPVPRRALPLDVAV